MIVECPYCGGSHWGIPPGRCVFQCHRCLLDIRDDAVGFGHEKCKCEPRPLKPKPPVIHVVTPESSSGTLWREIQRLHAVYAESARTIAHLNQNHREVSEMQQARIEELEKALTYIVKFADSMRKLGTAGLSPANLQEPAEPATEMSREGVGLCKLSLEKSRNMPIGKPNNPTRTESASSPMPKIGPT